MEDLDPIDVPAIERRSGEGRSALVILSRSRFGKSDLGVNRARITQWLEALDTPKA